MKRRSALTFCIKNVPFQVIGVLAPKGQSAQGTDQDDVIFVPFTTAERKVFGASFFVLWVPLRVHRTEHRPA